MRPLVTGAAVGVLALALAALGISSVVAAGGPQRAGGATTGTLGSGGDGRLVLISGRDDHGLLATAQVTLRQRPDAGTPAAQANDGELARVVSTKGTWVEVRTVENPSVQGWVDDFYLRGTVHLVGPAPACRVRLGGQWLAAGEQAVVLDARGTQALVRDAHTGRSGWVARSAVRELAPEHGCAGPAASAAPDAPGHGHDDDR